MKNAIVISLLFGMAHIKCMERSNFDKTAELLALPVIALFMAGRYVYEYHIKDQNVRLKEQFNKEQKTSAYNIQLGTQVVQNRQNDAQQLHAHLSNQTDLSPEDAALKQYVSQHLNYNN